MLTAVQFFTPQGDNLLLPLQDSSNGYVVRDIGGLDPVKATLVSSKFAKLDGEQFQSSYREKRNITLELGLEPDYVDFTVADLRSRLYDFFMPKSEVQLRFWNDGAAFVDIVGRVESFEAPLFTDDPKAALSVLCFDPDFIQLGDATFVGETVTGATLEMCSYIGSSPSGGVLTVWIDHSISELFWYNTHPDGTTQVLEFQAPLVAGDILKISTVPGDKYATLTRSGSTSSILYGVSPASTWINFTRGENGVRVVAAGAAMPWQIDYKRRYGGL